MKTYGLHLEDQLIRAGLLQSQGLSKGAERQAFWPTEPLSHFILRHRLIISYGGSFAPNLFASHWTITIFS